MRKINRIMATVSAQFSDLVDQVENHEAVAASALKRFRCQIQEAKVQVRLLEKDLDQAQNSREIATKNMELWKARAKREAEGAKEGEEEKALECVQRYQNAKKEVEFWDDKATQTRTHLKDLQKSLRQIECKYESMKLELQKYVARDRTAKVQSHAQSSGFSDGDCENSIDDVFRRWDRRLVHQEVQSEIHEQNVDDFALEMQVEEETEELRSTLKDIIEEN